MKKFFSTVVLYHFFISSFSQPYDLSKIDKKAIAVYDLALEKTEDRNFKEAVDLLKQAINIDPKYVDAYLSLAGVFGQMKNYKGSTEFYEKAFSLDSNYTNGYRLPYSINLAGQGEFQKALDAINSMMAHGKINSNTIKAGEYRKKTYEFAIDYSAKHPNTFYQFAPVNLGDSVNTSASEYYPSITINDSLLVFTRRGNGIREDFFESTILPNHEFSKAKKIEGSINDEPSKGAINISQDGEWLIFAGNFPGKGFGDFDLYISYLTPEGWSEPINMGPEINTEFWESSPSLSPDKKALYFSSNRPGGFGGKDLYVSYRNSNGKWSRAVNMGPSVNTKGDELAPFIHADNNTLYFTSDGLPGYGGSDLFVMRRKNTNEWNAPENLGYPINTIENEGSIFIASNGIDAFYASDRSDSRGGLDIYRFELREDIRPLKTLWVKGKVFDKKTLKGLPSSVELIEISTKETVSKVQTDELGNYFITLPIGKGYSFTVNRKGYLFYSDNFLLSRKLPDSIYEKNIPLQPIEINAFIVLNNIFFETNKYDLKPESQTELDKVIQLLNDNPTLKIEISGHTDNTGNSSDNLTLSNNRAKAVVNYLISKGISKQRLIAKGYGETKPVADNKTEEGRAFNRRTELKVISR
jgi:outer membrane protein OmpA-like peptidoglycan-associated protein/tetratricopeptide (TPR) repeat protein